MLTTAQKRYFDICAEKIANPGTTNQALADKFGASRTLVDTALRWGKRNDVFVFDSQDKLRLHQMALRETERKLYSAFQRHLRAPRDPDQRHDWKPSAGALSQLGRILLDYRTRILELEGLYKQVVTLQHSGELNLKRYETISPDDWDEDDANNGDSAAGASSE